MEGGNEPRWHEGGTQGGTRRKGPKRREEKIKEVYRESDEPKKKE
jgi:hypothetical protein